MIDTSLDFGCSNLRPRTSWSAWSAFGIGSLATILLVYMGIARPAAEELSLLRAQIESLEKGVAAVAGQRDSVDETNHLLGLLSQQTLQANAARKALIELQDLNAKIVAESGRAQAATAAVDQLVSIKELLLANAGRIEEAAAALESAEQLQERLADSAAANELALQASLDLLAIRSELLQSSDRNDRAKDTLRELVEIRSTLDAESSAIEIAHSRVEGLVQLKNSVLAQTEDLGESIETLEITNELTERFQRAASSYKDIRDWMIEVIALEPTLAQVRQVLEPIAGLVNLKRMDPVQLRDFARSFVQQSQERFATKSSKIVSLRSSTDDDAPADEDAANEFND